MTRLTLEKAFKVCSEEWNSLTMTPRVSIMLSSLTSAICIVEFLLEAFETKRLL